MQIAVNSRIVQTGNSGIPLFVRNLYAGLQQSQTHDSFRFFQTQTTPSLGKTEITPVPKGSIWNILFDSILVLFQIIRFRPEIFHGPSHILPIIKLPGTKYVLTVHDVSFITFPNMAGPLFRTVYTLLLRRSLAVADLVVTDSQNTKKDLIRLFSVPEHKIRVIYLGVSSAFFSPRKLPARVDGKYIFTVCTHPVRKNTLSILEAVAGSSLLRTYKLVIAGSYGNRLGEVIKKRARELSLEKSVLTLGSVSEADLISLYQNSSLFVYPSFYEGFGLPVLEAMACGTPVIASSVSSLPEIMPDRSWLVDPYDVSDIRKKMEAAVSISSTRHNSLIRTNQAFSRSFSWDKTTRLYARVFSELKTL